MKRNALAVAAATALIAVSVACDSKATTPAGPSSTLATLSDAFGLGPGGSSLKADAPVPLSPVTVTTPTLTPTLVITGGGTRFVTGTVQYRFRVTDETGAITADSGLVNGPIWALPAPLTPTSKYTWAARSEYRGLTGPWSTVATFATPVAPGNDYGDWESTCSSLPAGEPLVSCVWSFIRPVNSVQDLEVVKRVAWILRGTGVGLFLKGSGDNTVPWLGYTFSASRVCYPDGHLFKILSDAGPGGTNGPQWSDNDFVDVASYLPAIDPRIR